MNYNKYQKSLNINFLVVLTTIGIILILVGLATRESGRQIIIAATEYSPQGYRISPPFPLGGIKNVASSSINWEADTPDGTSITIKTAITENGENPPEFNDPIWQGVEKGGSIPDIETGTDLTGYLWTMQILETDDSTTTPQLNSLTETIEPGKAEGYRISPEFNLSGEDGEIVKDSRIFWQAEERADETIMVEVNVYTTEKGLTGWQKVVNGGRIPGLEPGTKLYRATIQTKTFFVGGSDYPSLKNIEIFVEIE